MTGERGRALHSDDDPAVATRPLVPRVAPVLAVLLFAAAARAQAPSESAAVARELFDQGRTLLAEKDYARACPKFEESYRIDPGGGTVLNLALCNELRGKVATAWAQYDEALRWARRDGRADRERFALEHRAALERRLGKLVVVLERGARIPGLSVRRDGVPLGEGSLGEALPVDAGEHVVEATAPHRKPLRMAVRARDGVVTTLTIPVLADDGTLKRPHAAAARSDGEASRTWGTVLVGTGAAAVFAAGALFVQALDRRAEAEARCPERACTDRLAVELNDGAQQRARVSMVLAASGLGVAGLGGYLYLAAGSDAPRTGMVFSGRF